jgi:flagellin
MISIQTNVNSLVAQQNLNVNNIFQSKTIQQLTSGYRINSSGDDAAGLAVANKFRSSIAELTQGVNNANDGVAQLQIMDGGMNNISQILDRLKTLATQSATGTFTGDRNVLNSEFQTDIGEIDRQAQSIGLNTGGVFAKSLSVYLGEGSGSQSLSNATVGLDLTSATVDSQSLGMKGLQAVLVGTGATSVDLGSGSTTSVADILNTSNNSGSEATSGNTDFYFSGSGFSDANKVKVSVNLSGVTDTASLVTAFNAAITAAGAGTSQAGAAFANAGIVASINTDSTGKQQLSFSSSSSAFQVEAGDKMANALMGNFVNASSTEGADIKTTATGGLTAATAWTPGNPVTVRIQGAGLASPVDLVVAANPTNANSGAAIASLQQQVAGSTALKAAGISLTTAVAGQALQFTSATGQAFNVMATGDTYNQLGLGSFVTNSTDIPTASGVDYSQITGGSYDYSSATAASDHATMQFSINGGATTSTSVGIDLTSGDAVKSATTSSAINTATTPIVAATAEKVTGSGSAVQTTNWSAAAESFTIAVDGAAAQTVALSTNYTVGTSNGALLTSINAQLGTLGVNATASFDATNHLVFTSNTAGVGSGIVLAAAAGSPNVLTHLGYGSTSAVAGTAGNNTLNLSVDGVAVTAQLTASTAAAATATGAKFAAGATVAITAASSGFSTGGSAIAASTTLNNAITFQVAVDGQPLQTITLAAGAYTNANNATAGSFAKAINDQLIGATANEVGGILTITSNTSGSASSTINLTADTGSAAQVTGTANLSAGNDFSSGGPYTFTATTNVGADTYTLTRDDANVADVVADLNYNNGSAPTHTKAIVDPSDGTKIEIVSLDPAGAASTLTLANTGGTPLTTLGLSTTAAHGDAPVLVTDLKLSAGPGTAGAAGNNQLIVDTDVAGYQGPAVVSIAAGTYNGSTILTAVNTALHSAGLNDANSPTSGVIASMDANGNLALSSSTDGATSAVTVSNSAANSAVTQLGLTAAVAHGTYTGTSATAASLVSVIQTAINTAVGSSGADATVTSDATGHIILTNNTAGAAHTISGFTGTATGWFGVGGGGNHTAGLNMSGTGMQNYLNQVFSSNTALKPAALTATWNPGVGDAGTLTISSGNDTNFRVDSGTDGTASVTTNTTSLAGGVNFSTNAGTHQAFQISTDGGSTWSDVVLGTNTTTAQGVVDALNARFTAQGVNAAATLSGNYVKLSSTATGAGASIQVQGYSAADQTAGYSNALAGGKILAGLNSARVTSDANLGFGVSGSSFAAANTLTSASKNYMVDSGGASSDYVTDPTSHLTNAISFSALKYGNDAQAITISGNDTNGMQHAATITLQDNSTTVGDNTAGRNIDQAISYINQQLQASNDPTLKTVVAVKETGSDGSDQINFLSSLNSLNVSVGSTANADGLAGGVSSSLKLGTVGSGANIAINTQAGAQAAVTAIAAAVVKLGSAQAAVGKGENQLSYAISLAQSQITNFSAAESNIRDANVAQEAANLTKAQVLQQASIAAMAQANSAPQAILTLLRG